MTSTSKGLPADVDVLKLQAQRLARALRRDFVIASPKILEILALTHGHPDWADLYRTVHRGQAQKAAAIPGQQARISGNCTLGFLVSIVNSEVKMHPVQIAAIMDSVKEMMGGRPEASLLTSLTGDLISRLLDRAMSWHEARNGSGIFPPEEHARVTSAGHRIMSRIESLAARRYAAASPEDIDAILGLIDKHMDGQDLPGFKLKDTVDLHHGIILTDDVEDHIGRLRSEGLPVHDLMSDRTLSSLMARFGIAAPGAGFISPLDGFRWLVLDKIIGPSRLNRQNFALEPHVVMMPLSLMLEAARVEQLLETSRRIGLHVFGVADRTFSVSARSARNLQSFRHRVLRTNLGYEGIRRY